MSDIEHLIELLEGTDFFYRMSTISDFRTLRKKLLSEDSVKDLFYMAVIEQKTDDLIDYLKLTIEDAKKHREVNVISLCAIVTILTGIVGEKSTEAALDELIKTDSSSIRWAADYADYCLRYNTSMATFTDYSLDQSGSSGTSSLASDVSDGSYKDA